MILLLSLAVASGACGCQPPKPAARPVADEFMNVLGGKYRLPGPHDCKAVVLIFTGHDCPISNGYAPEVARLCKEYVPKEVAFCVVYADADIKPDDASRHATEFGYPCPAILDPEMKLARRVGATVKPEAAVLSAQGELLYRGRINDLHADFGKKRPQPTTRDLGDALDAVLAGKPVPVARTKAVGCYIDFAREDK